MTFPNDSTDLAYPVLIVGAGPAGLATAIMLGRLGTPCLLVERRSAVGTHPRATGIRIRTMEIFRTWGLAAEIRRQALPNAAVGDFVWMHTLVGEELGRLRIVPDEASRAFRQSISPATNAFCPQDILEPIMLAALKSYPTVDVRLSTKVDKLIATERGVIATLRGQEDGTTRRVNARYVVACDGASSEVRSSLGIDLDGPDTVAECVNIHFRADLAATVGPDPAVIHWIVNSRSSGALITLDGRDRWLFTALPPLSEVDHPDRGWCEQAVRDAIGLADLPVEILSAKPLRMAAQVAKTFRAGDVFLVGDAAHRFPPTGGFGMNSSIQDAHNLAWKLHAVLAGWARPGLLDSYEVERRPIAEFNAGQSWRNLALMAETGIGPGVYEFAADIEAGAETGREAREQVRAAIPKQIVQFDALGQDLGFGYPAGALVSDGTPVPAPRERQVEFVPRSAPGFRAPHHELLRNGTALSTLDLFDTALTLLAGTDGHDWTTGARSAAAARGAPLQAYVVGADGDLVDPTGEWANLAGVGATGACLVRPDGHVAWRTTAPPGGQAETVVSGVLDVVLGRSE
nr:FAD-dependent monooxygenase [Kibdelosporangium sp. MJ126-NF4]CEL21738.1 Salicylate hydroxylase [Kibdelosporangium sp. MJ126-NF4]CTQ92518.1 Salicylate hydroxylase (EC 1.14.13.1) [Kibdelosporangium sp. MJ126-NF4]